MKEKKIIIKKKKTKQKVVKREGFIVENDFGYIFQKQ